MRALSLLLVFVATACVPRRPVFVAPQWGDAPPPRAGEVTEISLDRMSCGSGPCKYERIVFRRDGRAEREFRTGKQVDSVLVGFVDSLSFAALADSLVQTGFFEGGDDDEGRHEELQLQSVLVSAGTLCRSMVRGLAGETALSRLPAVGLIDSTVSRVSWERCCRA